MLRLEFGGILASLRGPVNVVQMIVDNQPRMLGHVIVHVRPNGEGSHFVTTYQLANIAETLNTITEAQNDVYRAVSIHGNDVDVVRVSKSMDKFLGV